MTPIGFVTESNHIEGIERSAEKIRKLLLIALEPEEPDFETGGADNPRIGSISAHHRSSASASPTSPDE